MWTQRRHSGRTPCDDEGRDQGDASTSQEDPPKGTATEQPRLAAEHQKPEGVPAAPSQLSEGADPANTGSRTLSHWDRRR